MRVLIRGLWLAPFLLLFFQNCKFEQAFESAGLSAQNSLGGGDGYDGKLFVNRVTENLCPDGSDVRSIIGIKADGSAEALRLNCQERRNEPLTLADDAYMPHNPENLIFDRKAFDVDPKISKDPRQTVWLCRGSETHAYYQTFHGIDIPGFRDRWGDIVIKPASAGAGHVARFKMAHYERGSTKVLASPVFDSGEFPVTMSAPDPLISVVGDLPGGGPKLNILFGRAADGTLFGKWLVLSPEGTPPPPGFTEPLSFNLNITCVPQE